MTVGIAVTSSSCLTSSLAAHQPPISAVSRSEPQHRLVEHVSYCLELKGCGSHFSFDGNIELHISGPHAHWLSVARTPDMWLSSENSFTVYRCPHPSLCNVSFHAAHKDRPLKVASKENKKNILCVVWEEEEEKKNPTTKQFRRLSGWICKVLVGVCVREINFMCTTTLFGREQSLMWGEQSNAVPRQNLHIEKYSAFFFFCFFKVLLQASLPSCINNQQRISF